MARKSKKIEPIRIEGELSCPRCRKPLRFIGDTLNYMNFRCDCPGNEGWWILLKTEELKEAYWNKQ